VAPRPQIDTTTYCHLDTSRLEKPLTFLTVVPEHPAATRGYVRVNVVGELAVLLDGVVLPSADVGSRKARTLLALLAVQRPRTLSTAAICAVLWPDRPPRRPPNNIATLVSRLRAVLGPDAVGGDRTGYQLGENVRVDLYDAAHFVTTAEAHLAGSRPAPALAGAAQALHLLDVGAVLPDYPREDWTLPAHLIHAALLHRARHAVSAAALATGDTARAVAVAEDAIRADPFDEVAYRLVLKAHDAAHEPVRALTAYERLRTTLARELAAHPSIETRNLHATILQRNAVSTGAGDARPTRSSLIAPPRRHKRPGLPMGGDFAAQDDESR
jgi:DNA-binding SARP family transcriptional activator